MTNLGRVTEPTIMLLQGKEGSVLSSAGYAFHDHRSGGNDGPRHDLDMTEDHCRPTYHATLADPRTPGDADTARDHGMVPDDAVVPDLDLIVQLDAIANDRIVQGSPIDRGIGSDFDVITDHHAADLRNLDPGALVRGKSESIGPDHRTGMDDRPFAYPAPGVNGGPAMQQAPLADTDTVPDDATAVNDDPIPEEYIAADDRLGTDADSRRHIRFDGRRRMHAQRGRREGMEQAGNPGVIRIGIGRTIRAPG